MHPDNKFVKFIHSMDKTFHQVTKTQFIYTAVTKFSVLF